MRTCMAMRTSSATLRAPIRSITQARWFSTVLGLMWSRAPISLLDNPAAATELADGGPAHAATWPTPADTAAQVAAVYAELLGQVP